MTAAWQVAIAVGEHSWLIEQDLEEEVGRADATVLDDLRFGWAMAGNPYPAQPDAMSAEFSLSLPNFVDYGDLAKGDPVAITVSVPAGGVVAASFYGRVTDLTAKPRDTKEDEDDDGVTLDVVAVDYTVDPAEHRVPPGPAVIPGDGIFEYDVLQTGFFNGYGDVLPGDVDGIPDLWTSPTDVEVPEPFLLEQRARLQVAAVLAQAVNTTTGTRMILSPLIAFGELPSSGRLFTLDTIQPYPDRDDAYDVLIDADTVDLAIAWTQVKGDAPDRVLVTYGESNLQTVATRSGATEPYVDIALQLQLNDDETTRADEIAGYYLPVDDLDNQWQVKSITWFVDQLDEDELAAFPATLFPQWTAAEGDPDRSACYCQRIWVHNVEPTVQPYSVGPFSGLQVGATARIRDGLLSIDLALRAARHHGSVPTP